MTTTKDKFLIGVVGPCAAGKTTLVAALESRGYRTRHIAQEHSYVKDMWRRLSHPDILVFLDVSYPVSLRRRKLNWDENEHAEQEKRLRHARAHADLLIETDTLTPNDILNKVETFIKETYEAPAP